jgi:hypothetical protein
MDLNVPVYYAILNFHTLQIDSRDQSFYDNISSSGGGMWRELLNLKTWRAAARENLLLFLPSMVMLLVLWCFGPGIISNAGDYLRERLGERGSVLLVGAGFLLILFGGLVLAKAQSQAEQRRQQLTRSPDTRSKDNRDNGQ